jgi:hypothetical protein
VNDVKKRSKWKRVAVVALKVYAGLCTLLVTAVLALILWEAGRTTQTSAGEHQQPTTVEEGDPMGLNFTGSGLSYDLPRAPTPVEGLFRRHAELDAVGQTSPRQPYGAANRSQPVGPDTNRPPAAAGSGR